MQLGAMLDLLIGFAFMFFLLSLVASSLQEMIAGFFSWRGTYLAKGLDVILDNKPDAGFHFAGIVDWLRAHFTFRPGRSVLEQYKRDIEPQSQWKIYDTATRAFFTNVTIPPRQQPNPVLAQVLNVQRHPLLRSTPSTLPSYVPAGNFSQALLGVLRDGSQSPLISQVQTTISALPDGDLKTTLTLFVQDAGGDIDAFRARLEKWFDDAMDRVGGLYKRLAQYTMFILGLGLAIVLNVSTSHVASVLWTTPSLRSALAAQAATAVEKGEDAGQSGSTPPSQRYRALLAQFEEQQFPIGWNCGQLPVNGVFPSLADTVNPAEDKILAAETKEKTDSTKPIPTGGAASDAKPPRRGATQYPANSPEQNTADQAQIKSNQEPIHDAGKEVACNSSVLTRKWIKPRLQVAQREYLGWLITAFAVSFGAPFWFDLLQNLVNLRNAGQKPQKSDASS
jgi:hypothetical protein